MVSFEDKQKNKQHILNNIIDYSIDGRGFIFHIEKTQNGELGDNCVFYEGSVVDYKELVGEIENKIIKNRNEWKFTSDNHKVNALIVLEILKEKENWEIVANVRFLFPKWVRNKITGLKIDIDKWTYSDFSVEYLVGDLGYRKLHWETWENDNYPQRKFKSILEELKITTSSPNQNSCPNNYVPSRSHQTINNNLPPTTIPPRNNNDEIINTTQIPNPVSKQPSQSTPTSEKTAVNSQQQNPPISNEKTPTNKPTNKIPTPLIIINLVMVLLLTIIVLKKRKRKK